MHVHTCPEENAKRNVAILVTRSTHRDARRATEYIRREEEYGASCQTSGGTDLPVQVAKRQIASRAARFLGNLQAEEENGDY